MRVTLTFEDRGAQTVAFDMDAAVEHEDTEINRPTPSAILALAVKAMFNNGMLARAGQIALEGASKGIDPAEYVAAAYQEKALNDNSNP